MPPTAEEVSNDLLDQVRSDPELFARLMETVFGTRDTWTCPTEQLLVHDEARAVEYKQTARWNVREERKDKTMEQVIVRTVAGMLNHRGGTLLIGVTDDGEPVGLADDYAQVKPPNADGYVNWLDTLFENNLGHAGANRLTIRIDQIDGHDICRIDVPASSPPHLGQEQGRSRHPLPTPQQLHETGTTNRGRRIHRRTVQRPGRKLICHEHRTTRVAQCSACTKATASQTVGGRRQFPELNNVGIHLKCNRHFLSPREAPSDTGSIELQQAWTSLRLSC